MSNIDSNHRPWLRDRPRFQLGALLLLTIVLFAHYPQGFLAPSPLGDEVAYVTASELVAAGQSPYYGLYLYPPVLAVVGAAVIQVAGDDALLVLLRTFNGLGIALLVWWSVALWSASFHWRLIAAVLYICVSPALAYGILWGNISLGIATLIFLGLLLWPIRPMFAGVLLGASIAVKPIAPGAVLVLLLQRMPSLGKSPVLKFDAIRTHWIAGLTSLVVAGGLLLVPPYLREWLSLTMQIPPYTRNVALYRALVCFGAEPPTLGLFATVTILAVLWARRPLHGAKMHSPWQVLVIAIPTTLLSLPLVWSHTLLLTLPLQVAALDRAGWSLRDSGVADRPRKPLEMLVVLAMVLVVQLSDGVGGIDDQAYWLQGLVILIPALAPLGLSLYLLTPGTMLGARRRPPP